MNAELLAEAERVGRDGFISDILFDISLDNARRLASLRGGADLNVVLLGTMLMDCRIKEATKTGQDHVALSLACAANLLDKFDMSKGERDMVLNCVEAHHGAVPYLGIEAEICANADCYRFIHPKGVLYYLTLLGKRNGTDIADWAANLKQAEYKLDEKYAIISLPEVKEELEPHYKQFKELFAAAK